MDWACFGASGFGWMPSKSQIISSTHFMAHIFMALTWEVAAKNQQVHIWLILLGHYDYHVTSFCWQRSSPRWVVEHHTCICDWGFMLPFQWCFVLMGLQFHPTHAKSFGHVQTYWQVTFRLGFQRTPTAMEIRNSFLILGCNFQVSHC